MTTETVLVKPFSSPLRLEWFQVPSYPFLFNPSLIVIWNSSKERLPFTLYPIIILNAISRSKKKFYPLHFHTNIRIPLLSHLSLIRLLRPILSSWRPRYKNSTTPHPKLCVHLLVTCRVGTIVLSSPSSPDHPQEKSNEVKGHFILRPRSQLLLLLPLLPPQSPSFFLLFHPFMVDPLSLSLTWSLYVTLEVRQNPGCVPTTSDCISLRPVVLIHKKRTSRTSRHSHVHVSSTSRNQLCFLMLLDSLPTPFTFTCVPFLLYKIYLKFVPSFPSLLYHHHSLSFSLNFQGPPNFPIKLSPIISLTLSFIHNCSPTNGNFNSIIRDALLVLPSLTPPSSSHPTPRLHNLSNRNTYNFSSS